jgi:phage shock protein C
MTSTPIPALPTGQDETGEQPPAPGTEPARPSLRRSNRDRMLGGVCGGLAEHTGVDALLWRVGFVGLVLAGGSGVLVYLLLWVLVAPAPRGPQDRVGSLDRLAERLHDALTAAAGPRGD